MLDRFSAPLEQACFNYEALPASEEQRRLPGFLGARRVLSGTPMAAFMEAFMAD